MLGVYLSVTVFSALFGAVYELFSHGVYSYCMIYAFAFPLLLGALPFVFSRTIPHFVDALFETTSGFTTTGASIVIYGTENVLINVYWIVGGMLTAAGWLLAVLRKA